MDSTTNRRGLLGAIAATATAAALPASAAAAQIQGLAEAFEAAWRAEANLPEDCTDEQVEAVCEHTSKFVDQILDLPTPSDPAVTRLRARAYLWTRQETVEEIVKTEETTDRKLLGALLRDLNADAVRKRGA
jgi:hypothetical protein